MKLTQRSTGTLLGLMLLGAGLSVPGLRAQPVPGQVQVRGVIRSATYDTAGGAPGA